MSTYPVIWNGEWIENGERGLPAWDRSFHFGDGFFETFRAVNHCPLFLDRHLERGKRAMERMGMDLPADWNEAAITSMVTKLLEEHGCRNGRFRLTGSRAGKGAYTPETDKVNLLVEMTGETTESFEFPAKGVRIGTYEGMIKHPGLLSCFKGTSAAIYVMAKRWARANGFDEALILGSSGTPIESASSNLFLIHGDRLITPPIEEGCVDGVMRSVLIDVAREQGWQAEHAQLRVSDLLEAEEILLSNAVQGIQPVSAFKDQRYFKEKGKRLLQGLNERAFSSG
ncbi:MAG: aminotransferase class IV [Flavobacteriales bacterium]